MTRSRLIRWLTSLGVAAAVAACGGNDAANNGGDAPSRGFEPPVALNAESPVHYPPALYTSHVEGTVVLRLYVDSTGAVVPDSSRVAESSGTPALDSAALAGVPDMRFAPATRNGIAVATAFLQPVHFRHPEGTSLGGNQ